MKLFYIKETFTKSKALVQNEKAHLVAMLGSSYLRAMKSKKTDMFDSQGIEQEKSQGDTKKNSLRGRITKFSRKSRLNLMHTIAKVKRDCLPSFVTLTYPKEYPFEYQRWKRDLKSLVKRLDYAFPGISGIWKLEPQKRGAPHFHVIVWGVPVAELQEYIPQAWYEIAGNGDEKHLQWHKGELGNPNCVSEVKTLQAMYNYVAKYVAKDLQDKMRNVGRWWGIFYRDRLPLGEEVIYDITDKKVIEIMRYFRRFANIRSRQYETLVLVCDVDQWMEKLSTVPMGSFQEWDKRIENGLTP